MTIEFSEESDCFRVEIDDETELVFLIGDVPDRDGSVRIGVDAGQHVGIILDVEAEGPAFSGGLVGVLSLPLTGQIDRRGIVRTSDDETQ